MRKLLSHLLLLLSVSLPACCLASSFPREGVTPPPQEVQSKKACSSEWHTGTLTMIRTFEPGVPPVLVFVLPGYGSNADTCVATPSHCESYACQVNSSSPETCFSVPIPSCVQYEVLTCGGVSTIRHIESPYGSVCP